jgi:hypothetical protein
MTNPPPREAMNMDEKTRRIYREAFCLKETGNDWRTVAKALEDQGYLTSKGQPFRESTLRKEYSIAKKDPEKWRAIMGDDVLSEQAERSEQGESSEQAESSAHGERSETSHSSEHGDRSESAECSDQAQRSELHHPSDQYEHWEDRMQEIAQEVCQFMIQNVRDEMKELMSVPHIAHVQNDMELPPEPISTGRAQNRIYGKLSATTDGVLRTIR